MKRYGINQKLCIPQKEPSQKEQKKKDEKMKVKRYPKR